MNFEDHPTSCRWRDAFRTFDWDKIPTEVMVGSAQDRFDAKGSLTDPKTRQKIAELLAALNACARHRSALA